MITLLRDAVALILLWACLPAVAANINCTTMVVPDVPIFYVNNTTVSMQGTFTVTCSRNPGGASSVSYTVTHNVGNSPKATNSGGATVNYTLGRSSCSDQWLSGGTIADSLALPNSGTAYSKTTSFFVCVPSQTVAGAAGLYQQLVTLTANPTTGPQPSTSFHVNITAPASCIFTTNPGNISMSYVALGPQVIGSTTFNVQCTTLFPYTLATDVPEGVLQNLRYILSLSSTTANGTGAPQTYTVTATIPAGQSGCGGGGCGSNTNSHSVIISY
ncbi:MAG TPA: hypothetical protein VN649_21540 [Ramlibacter sp.]|nr:hypothetical protein [Ramlibacter sp.]